MTLGSAIVLGTWALIAIAVAQRLWSHGRAAFQPLLSGDGRRLIGASALFLGAPLVVGVSHLAQAVLLTAWGPGVEGYEPYVFWGLIHPAGALDPALRIAVSAIGAGLPALSCAFVFASLWLRRGRAAVNFVRLELGRTLMVIAFGVQPVLSILLRRGDVWALREALGEVRPELADVFLLGLGVIASFAFWAWRRADRLRSLGTPLFDVARGAEARLANEPFDADALRTLGAAQLGLGDDRAVATLGHARTLAPDDPMTAFLHGRANLHAGDALAATDGLRAAGQLLVGASEPEPRLLYEVTLSLGAARIALDDPDGALQTADAALDLRPRDPRSAVLQADALLAARRGDEARAVLQAALPRADGSVETQIRVRLAMLDDRR